jgi:hypothetical protein
MSGNIPDEAIAALIRIGASRTSTPPEELMDSVSGFDAINRLGRADWIAAAKDLSEGAHRALAKGLVLAEESHRWAGGSVAAAIWVFSAFEDKFPNHAEELADWMLVHSNNQWVPLGTNRGSARSMQQVRERNSCRAEYKQQKALEETKHSELKAAKEAARQRLIHYRERVQKALSEVRQDLLKQLELLPGAARIEHLAWDDENPLSFYPASLVAEADDAWGAIAPETRDTLLARASSIPRGEWREWWKSHREL